MNTHDYNSENNNPSDYKTTLQLYCDYQGWQGGNITQAINHFKASPLSSQDKVCGMLLNNMGNVSDIETIKTFMNIRNSYLSANQLQK